MSYANLFPTTVSVPTGATGAYIADNIATINFTPVYPINGNTGTFGSIMININWTDTNTFVISNNDFIYLTAKIPEFAKPKTGKVVPVTIFIAHPNGQPPVLFSSLIAVNPIVGIALYGNSLSKFVVGDGVGIFNLSGIYPLS